MDARYDAAAESIANADYSARAVSDKVLAASAHIVRHHNHRGAKNRGPCLLEC